MERKGKTRKTVSDCPLQKADSCVLPPSRDPLGGAADTSSASPPPPSPALWWELRGSQPVLSYSVLCVRLLA